MVKQDRHNDRMKGDQLNGVRASCQIESGNIKHIVKLLSFRLVQCITEGLPFRFLHFKHNSKGRYCSTHSLYYYHCRHIPILILMVKSASSDKYMLALSREGILERKNFDQDIN